MSSSRSTTELALLALTAWTALVGPSCTTESGGMRDSAEEDPTLSGTITYPFVEEGEAIGKEPEDERFIIRSAVGDREYAVEIPGAARDYDVQVPLADLGESDPNVLSGAKPKHLASPVPTDREMVATLPRLDKERPTDTALLDGAMGVGDGKGPPQAPSYTLGIAKINQYYKRREWEYALVELNALLAFYPTSPQLLKMKGTVLVKTRNLALAELAWIRALELAPEDRILRGALKRLQQRITQTGGAKTAPPKVGPTAPTTEIPAAIGTAAPKNQDAASALTH